MLKSKYHSFTIHKQLKQEGKEPNRLQKSQVISTLPYVAVLNVFPQQIAELNELSAHDTLYLLAITLFATSAPKFNSLSAA